MSRSASNHALRLSRSRWSGAWRRWSTGLPVVTWIAALAVAGWLYRRSTLVGETVGYAEDVPVTLTHYEPAVVQHVHVGLFEPVSRGQVLVSLDDRPERLELAVIEEDIDRLRAAVLAERERLRADNIRAEAGAQDQVRQFAVDREDARIAYLSECVADAEQQALLRGRRIDYEIVYRLAASGDASPRELNDIRTTVEELEAATAARAEVLARAQESFAEADRRWQEFIARPTGYIATETVLTPLRMAVDVRMRDLEDVVRRLETHVVRAPVDGRVASIGVGSGAQVPAGTLLVSVTPSSTGDVIAYLPERLALRVRAGDRVTAICVATTAEGVRRYVGQVTQVAAGVTEAPIRYRPFPTFPVWGRGVVIALSNDVRLIPGEAVRISFRED